MEKDYCGFRSTRLCSDQKQLYQSKTDGMTDESLAEQDELLCTSETCLKEGSLRCRLREGYLNFKTKEKWQ